MLTLLTVGAAPATADAFLLYGPSLAVWLQDQNGPVPTTSAVHAHQAASGRGGGAPFLIDESHMLVDAGHTVTIVDDAEAADALVPLELDCRLAGRRRSIVDL